MAGDGHRHDVHRRRAPLPRCAHVLRLDVPEAREPRGLHAERFHLHRQALQQVCGRPCIPTCTHTLPLARSFPPAATDGRAHARRTTTESPNPSVGSGATDDDYRIDIQSHSRNSSQSPRRRRPNDKDAAPLGVGHANADYYGVQPGGQGGQTKSDLEVCFVCRLPCQLSLPSICHAHGQPNWSEPSMLLPAWPRSE